MQLTWNRSLTAETNVTSDHLMSSIQGNMVSLQVPVNVAPWTEDIKKYATENQPT